MVTWMATDKSITSISWDSQVMKITTNCRGAMPTGALTQEADAW